MALVDVVIPTRNRIELTTQAVRSVQAQTFSDWALVIIDDGGDDGSGERLAEVFAGDGRIQVISRPRLGPERTRDFGVRAGSSPWVALLDSDDLWLPTKLERQLAAVDEHVDVVLCWYEWFRPDGSVRTTGKPTGAGRVSPLLTDNMSTPLVRRDTLASIGGLGHQPGLGPLTACEGIEFYVRLLTRAHVAVVPEVLVRCRDHPGVRESAKLSGPEGAIALDAVASYHSSALAEWPREHSLLLARAAARYVAAGMTGTGYRRFQSAFRIAPPRCRPALVRRYGPFMVKDVMSRLNRRVRT